MRTAWDYTTLAKAYLKRPDYAKQAISRIVEIANMNEGDKVCDVGAGVAHLTLMLAKAGLAVTSIEPNDEMRKYGENRTHEYANVSWYEGVAEKTGQESNEFGLVTFGSSFNVCHRMKALAEVGRIAVKNGWFAALWNHRDLSNPVQLEIESIIARNIDGYQYGTRREQQNDIIRESGLFKEAIQFSEDILHRQSVEQVIEAWRSHATLNRQAGDSFNTIISSIASYLNSLGVSEITVPYTTNVWMAQLK